MVDNSKLADQSPKYKLAVALDFDDEAEALKFVDLMEDRVKVYKVGLELFSVAGPLLVAKLIDRGYDIFVDLKLHDIPNTVYGAAKALGKLGARYITVHSSGGIQMLKAANEGFNEGWQEAGLSNLRYCLGVTVLTSDPQFSDELLEQRVDNIVAAGLSGLVCSGMDLSKLNATGHKLYKVVPGIRPDGSSSDDQLRVTTPLNAIKLGANLLVVGRPITQAEDPVGVVNNIMTSLL